MKGRGDELRDAVALANASLERAKRSLAEYEARVTPEQERENVDREIESWMLHGAEMVLLYLSGADLKRARAIRRELGLRRSLRTGLSAEFAGAKLREWDQNVRKWLGVKP